MTHQEIIDKLNSLPRYDVIPARGYEGDSFGEQRHGDYLSLDDVAKLFGLSTRYTNEKNAVYNPQPTIEVYE